jgi:hypothetical protein
VDGKEHRIVGGGYLKMNPEKFLSSLQLFSSAAHTDEIADFYVPSIPEREDSRWYGIVKGTYQYGGKSKWMRDYRVRMNFIVTDKPFLWGRTFMQGFQTGFLLPTAEENSKMFFGCRGWSEFLSTRFIQRYVGHRAKIGENAEALRKAGATKDEFAHLIRAIPYDLNFLTINREPLIMRRTALLVEAYQCGMLQDPDLGDMLAWLHSLNLSVREAKQLWKTSSAGRKITVSYEGSLMDYRAKKSKDTLHDFLAAVVGSCERKHETLRLAQVEFPDTLPFAMPEGVQHIKTATELAKVSKRHGWCAGQKHYRDGAVKGDWYFLFDPTQCILMQYAADGRLMQARGPSNSLVEHIPERLPLTREYILARSEECGCSKIKIEEEDAIYFQGTKTVQGYLHA